MQLHFDPIKKEITDGRAPEERILMGGPLLTYTLLTDDITRGEKPS